jgi:hypothetical protein
MDAGRWPHAGNDPRLRHNASVELDTSTNDPQPEAP